MENPIYRWMRTAGTPMSGNHRMCQIWDLIMKQGNFMEIRDKNNQKNFFFLWSNCWEFDHETWGSRDSIKSCLWRIQPIIARWTFHSPLSCLTLGDRLWHCGPHMKFLRSTQNSTIPNFTSNGLSCSLVSIKKCFFWHWVYTTQLITPSPN